LVGNVAEYPYSGASKRFKMDALLTSAKALFLRHPDAALKGRSSTLSW